MKKIAIVTWIRGCNYGTILQAYALSDYLNKNGQNAVLLDDTNLNKCFDDGQKAENIASDPPPKSDGKIVYYYKKIKKAAAVLLKPEKRREYLSSRAFERASQGKLSAFNGFKDKYLRRTTPLDKDDLEKTGKDYDAYICGSDQIWTYRSDLASEYFYLGFTADDKQRIAYAPCIGDKGLPDSSVPILKEYLSRFFAISMRDEYGAELIKGLVNRDISIVCDPVLLKTREEWVNDFSLTNSKQKYLLCYILGKHKWYEEKIKKISRKLGLRIRWIPVNPEQASFLKKKDFSCGPREFLDLVYNASFVCTDSFHGTLFSLIFEKQFVNLERYSDTENSQNQRFYSIYRRFCLPNRLIGETDPVNELTEIRYDKVREKIDEFREASRDFLLKTLG